MSDITKGRIRLTRTLGARGLKHDGGIRGLAAASDNSFYASVGEGERIRLWDSKTGESLGHIIAPPAPNRRESYALALSDDSRFAYVASRDVQIFDILEKRFVRALPVTSTTYLVNAVAAHAGLVLYGDDKRPRLFDHASSNAEDILAFKNHSSKINACALSPDGAFALSCGSDRTIYVHDLNRKKKKAKVLAILEGYVRSCGFAPDGRTAWTVGWDHVRVFEYATGTEVFALEGPLAKARIGAMSPNGHYLAVAYEAEIQLFDLRTKEVVKRIACARAETMAFDHDGARLLVANHGYGTGEGCAIEVFDVEHERRVLPADEGHIGAVMDLAIPRDRPTTLMSVGVDARVLVWDLESGATIEQLGPLSAQGHAIATTPDGRRLATTSRDGKTMLWDLTKASARAIPTDDQLGRQPVDVALSPDGRFLVYSGRSKTGFYTLSDADDALAATEIPAGFDAPLAFRGDGELYTGGDSTIKRWSLPSGVRADGGTGLECSASVPALSILAGPREHIIAGTAGSETCVFDTVSNQRVLRRFAYGLPILAVVGIKDDHYAVLRLEHHDADPRATVVEIWPADKQNKVEQPEATVDLFPLEDRARSMTASPDGRYLCVGTNVGTILVFEVLD